MPNLEDRVASAIKLIEDLEQLAMGEYESHTQALHQVKLILTGDPSLTVSTCCGYCGTTTYRPNSEVNHG